MNVFLVCLEAVLPIFITMLIGYAARLSGLMGESDVRRINKINFRSFMPIMLFESIYASDIETAVNPGLIVYSVIAVLIMLALCFGFVMLVEKENSRRGVMIQGLYRSNFALVGIPVADALMQGGDISVVAVQLAVVVPIFNIAAVLILEGFGGTKPNIKHLHSVIALEVFSGQRIRLKQVLINIIKNPLIIASVLGLVFLALDIQLPSILSTVVEDMAAVAGPLALFTLGAFFRFKGIGKYKKELLLVGSGRLIVIPGIFLTAGYLLGFRGADFAGIMGLFASCSAIASYIMAEQMGGDSELAGNIVICTSFLCSFSMYLWAVLFMSLGAF